MTDIIDVSSDCGTRASALAMAGVKTVIRYYSRDTIRPSKPIRRAEADKLTAAGLRLGIVYEGRYGDKAFNFERATGVADGVYARHYAATEIDQPGGSTIYFAVDFDASAAEIRDRILPYFQGVADAFGKANGEPDYTIGVYGSGATCKAVLDAGLAKKAWLCQSKGWAGYAAFDASGRWSLKQGMPVTVAEVPCDPNVAAGSEIGDFLRGAAQPAATAGGAGYAVKVIARSGLRMRAGPGTEFDRVRLLPFGAVVTALKTVGDWTMIDLEGDGAADGFASTAFLEEAGGGPVKAKAAVSIPDAVHVPELLRQGRSAEGLKKARLAAAASLPGYPTNGCAVHLSMLLRQSGIAVPVTWGAGKLAHLIAERGWTKIAVGKQIPGDVGVTFDNDPTPAGADHIYLVVETLGPDEMMIADNQRTVDKPHARFASGKGKTPTEYFLRAV